MIVKMMIMIVTMMMTNEVSVYMYL